MARLITSSAHANEMLSAGEVLELRRFFCSWLALCAGGPAPSRTLQDNSGGETDLHKYAKQH